MLDQILKSSSIPKNKHFRMSQRSGWWMGMGGGGANPNSQLLARPPRSRHYAQITTNCLVSASKI